VDWASWFWGLFFGFFFVGICWIWTAISRHISPPEPATKKSVSELLIDPSGIYWLWEADSQTSWWFDPDGTGAHGTEDGERLYFLWRPESEGCISIRHTHSGPEDFPPSPLNLSWSESISTTFFRFTIHSENGRLWMKYLETEQVFFAD
jgi:hypothetical protein